MFTHYLVFKVQLLLNVCLQLPKLSSILSWLGGDEEDRTPDPLLARQVLSQLSYTPKFNWLLNFVQLVSLSDRRVHRYIRKRKLAKCQNLVGLSGLEPPTSRLSGVRSNRLSYRPIGSMLDSYLFSHIFFIQYSYLNVLPCFHRLYIEK